MTPTWMIHEEREQRLRRRIKEIKNKQRNTKEGSNTDNTKSGGSVSRRTRERRSKNKIK